VNVWPFFHTLFYATGVLFWYIALVLLIARLMHGRDWYFDREEDHEGKLVPFPHHDSEGSEHAS